MAKTERDIQRKRKGDERRETTNYNEMGNQKKTMNKIKKEKQ